ncbi:MAG: aminotransferase class V-fold PLP-dependent enzyme [Caldilineaceae bacterium]
MTTPYQAGRHFLQIPGPTNLPERVGRALSRSTIDHRGPEFAQLTLSIFERLQTVFQGTGPVLIFPSSATGCWEAALVNTLSPGDKVLFCESGHFAERWTEVATRLGLTVERLAFDWRCGVDPAAVEARLADDQAGVIKAVALVHNETSTGLVNDVAAVRQALERANHNALLMIDVVSSIGAMDYRHDEWGRCDGGGLAERVDVAAGPRLYRSQ